MATKEEAGPEPSRAALVKEWVIASMGVLLVLALIKHGSSWTPVFREYGATLAVAFQLYFPLVLVGRRGISHRSLGLGRSRLGEDLGAVFVLCLVTFIPFAVGHHLWQQFFFGRPFHLAPLSQALIDGLPTLLVVALAEELYFRGYLLERAQRVWAPWGRVFGVGVGPAVVLTSLVFALAHFVGEYQVTRLGPFFPGLLFGLLRNRSGLIWGAFVYHALCNLWADWLWRCYV